MSLGFFKIAHKIYFFCCELQKNFNLHLLKKIIYSKNFIDFLSFIKKIRYYDSMCLDLFVNNSVEAVQCNQWVQNYTECLPLGPNPARGTISFDNIGLAWVAIFQVISLEGWTEVMYLIQDAYSFWVWIYFVVLIVVSFNF